METVGPYRVVKELGRGAMGVVFEAFDPAIGRTVALKVILSQPQATAEEDAQAKLRFAREASAAGRLSHPNIVTVYQLGEHDGAQYLVMEYVTGVSLEAMLAPAVPLSFPSALGILTQIAAALDCAHALGVVHRDIKPANILVTRDGTVKLTDFGIARIASQNMTQTGFTMGTPAYMAPEQIMASKVDGRADQFSLAVVAFQMLSGKRPFEAPTVQALMFKIVSGKPRRIEEANALLPRAVAEVISRGLSKDPARRYRNCSEFAADLRAALASPAAPATVAGRPQSAPAPEPRPAIARRLRGWPLIAACALVGVAAVAAGAWFVSLIDRGPEVTVKDAPKAAVAAAPRKQPALTATQPASSTKVNPKDRLTYVWIPPGTFAMGCSPGDTECLDSERPAHQVTITNGFWMGQTPVTQEAYERVVRSNPSHIKGAELPVESVTWTEAQSYCQAVGMRLPTEAEYEYAARGGSTGSRYGDLDRIAWYANNSANKTREVGLKQANAWGLHDVLGNVWEWVADWYDAYPAGSQRDPGGPASGQYRVLRGGSSLSTPKVARASYRFRHGPENRNTNIGLRCAGN